MEMGLANTELDQLYKHLSAHEAVDDLALLPGKETVACIVPSNDKAGPIRRACEFEESGKLQGLSIYEPSSGFVIAQKNRMESDFLYREIFIDNAYLQHGIRLPKNASVIDVGANIGLFALFVAQKSPGSSILCVEPVTELAEAIRINGEIHGVDLTVVNSAIGSTSGTVNFTYYPNNTAMSGFFADEIRIEKCCMLT